MKNILRMTTYELSVWSEVRGGVQTTTDDSWESSVYEVRSRGERGVWMTKGGENKGGGENNNRRFIRIVCVWGEVQGGEGAANNEGGVKTMRGGCKQREGGANC